MSFRRLAWPNSIGFKVLLAFAGGALLSIALLALTAFVLFQGQTLARLDLDDAAQGMAEHIRFDSAGRPLAWVADEEGLSWVFDSLGGEIAYRVMDVDGRTVLQSEAGAALWLGAQVRPAPGRFDLRVRGLHFLGASELVERAGRHWYFQVVVSERLMGLLHRVALPLAGAGIALSSLVLLLAFGACAWLTLRYTLAPLRAVSESAAAISPRLAHARLTVDAVPLEIAPLVHSFNAALARLEHGYRVQQEFLGHAAHELKTPLALIRAQIELSDGDPAGRADLLADVAYMTRQVQQLLLLAEVSEVHNYRFADIDVARVARDAVDYMRRPAQHAGVHVHLSVQAGTVSWHADAEALFTLLKNLLENAVQHAPAGSTVAVDLGRSSLTVRDRGSGVAPEQLPHLFERFWRGEHRKDKGTGLGLAICQEVAMAHGWELTATRAQPGLLFCLRIPSPDGVVL